MFFQIRGGMKNNDGEGERGGGGGVLRNDGRKGGLGDLFPENGRRRNFPPNEFIYG